MCLGEGPSGPHPFVAYSVANMFKVKKAKHHFYLFSSNKIICTALFLSVTIG